MYSIAILVHMMCSKFALLFVEYILCAMVISNAVSIFLQYNNEYVVCTIVITTVDISLILLTSVQALGSILGLPHSSPSVSW